LRHCKDLTLFVSNYLGQLVDFRRINKSDAGVYTYPLTGLITELFGCRFHRVNVGWLEIYDGIVKSVLSIV